MITASLTLNKDQLDIAMLSIRDSIDWYRKHITDFPDIYAQRLEEYLDVEEIISDARRELIMQELKGSRK